MLSLLKRCLKNPRFWQVALAGYWLALFISTHLPIVRLASSHGTTDKFVHVAAFTGLSILLAITWRLSAGRLRGRDLVSVWALVMLYGALEETTQPLMNRTASHIDWLADAIGATLGLAIYQIVLEHWIARFLAASRNEPEKPDGWRRYSLRTLFVVMTLAALVSYWTMLPTMNAQHFVRALQEQDFATAERLFISDADAFPGRFKTYDFFHANANIAPLTWNDFRAGERRINVAIDYGDDGGMIGCGADITSYRNGLKMGLIVP
jgi:VanZ family protein